MKNSKNTVVFRLVNAAGDNLPESDAITGQIQPVIHDNFEDSEMTATGERYFGQLQNGFGAGVFDGYRLRRSENERLR
jgi:hypothetical protein